MISNKQMGFDFGPKLYFIKIINGILKNDIFLQNDIYYV